MPAYIRPTWDNWIANETRTIQMRAYNQTYIWNSWATGTTATTGGITIYDSEAWGNWNSTYTSNRYVTAENHTVWNNWLNDYADGEGWIPGWNAPIDPRDVAAMDAQAYRARGITLGEAREALGFGGLVRSRTEEEWAVIREEQERQRAERDVLQAAARAQARQLMELVLTPEQLRSYDQRKFFEVVGSEGGLFRIYHGTSGNIKQVVDGQEINALCVHPRMTDHRVEEGEGYGYLPTEDCLIAQAFAIMHDELGTVNTANVHRGVRHLRAVPEAA